MRTTFAISILLFVSSLGAQAQNVLTAGLDNNPLPTSTSSGKKHQVVKITGVRFSYPLLQHWIDRFNEEYSDVQVIIESRGSSDPSHYDILIEAYEHPEEIRKYREYIYVARYPILPVANAQSEFAKLYTEKGLNKDLITQLFFHDIYVDKEKQKEIKAPFTVYTRLQKASVPIVFSSYFGYEQKDIKGKAIAGADEHLVKALLRDSTGISYAPLPLIYDHRVGTPVNGIAVLPVDLNGNGRINDEERFYGDESRVIARFEERTPKELQNVPLAYLHLSVDKKTASMEAVLFLRWIINNGEGDLHAFGYLKPEPRNIEKEKFEQFASKKTK